MAKAGKEMSHEALNPAQNWLLELCDHHSIRFRCNYWAFLTIQEAMRAKGKCVACKLDIPNKIELLHIRKVDY